MPIIVVRPSRRSVFQGIADHSALGHQAIEVTVLSATDVADYDRFIRRLRRPRAEVGVTPSAA